MTFSFPDRAQAVGGRVGKRLGAPRMGPGWISVAVPVHGEHVGMMQEPIHCG